MLFPLVDTYQRFVIVPKEFALTNLQVLNVENAIVDVSTQIRYIITDVIKASTNVQDIGGTIKSLARGILVSIISKRDANKIETENHHIKYEIQASQARTYSLIPKHTI